MYDLADMAIPRQCVCECPSVDAHFDRAVIWHEEEACVTVTYAAVHITYITASHKVPVS
jgi:hypothetical protein